MLSDEEIKYCREKLNEQTEWFCDFSYILVSNNDDQPKKYKIIAFDKENEENICCLELQGENTNFYHVPEWDFNIEDYLLYDLENGYDMGFAPLEQHYGLWCSIDQWKDEIEHTDGLQSYLKYCKQNDITPKTIGHLGLNKVDITNLYQEMNGSYKIIAEVTCNDESIVLGYSKSNPSPYVTWWTTPNRQHGYDTGCYCTNFNEGYNSLKKRSYDLMEKKLEHQRAKAKPVKEKTHER